MVLLTDLGTGVWTPTPPLPSPSEYTYMSNPAALQLLCLSISRQIHHKPSLREEYSWIKQ